ncbi:MAG: hypothetical protein QM690_14530 [Sphingobium sp.]
MIAFTLLLLLAIKICLFIGMMLAGGWLAFWGMILALAIRLEWPFVIVTLCGLALFFFGGWKIAALTMTSTLG